MLLDFVRIEESGNGAMYQALYRAIRDAAASGKIKPGERLPSLREASGQLGVSRTTVENAYLKLCLEGIAESAPQRGYTITAQAANSRPVMKTAPAEQAVRYDFSGRKITSRAADTDLWKKTVREVLRDTEELTSYGDPQGEARLRRALSAYTYKARGVQANPDNIVIGAGVGTLLNLLCGLTGREKTVGFENGGFSQAQRVFADYGIATAQIESDRSGARPDALQKSGADILFLLPSSLSRLRVTELAARRNRFAAWAAEKEGRWIIEDDYNGELRYTARSVPAFQPKMPDRTVYIGSFSKLLLPSVRIAYMVLPDPLVEAFRQRRALYNQTCGKVEQLALAAYIEAGSLERHLRRLRKLYAAKSRAFLGTLETVFPQQKVTLYESSVTAEIRLPEGVGSAAVCAAALKEGVRVLPGKREETVRLCFAGMGEESFLPALTILRQATKTL